LGEGSFAVPAVGGGAWGFPLGAGRLGDVLLWGCVLIAVVLALGFVLVVLRKKYHPASGGEQDGRRGFSIEGLEALRREGQISEEEFRRLRRAALGLASQVEEKDDPALSVAEEDDDG
jgi:hypothetical protein